MQFFASNLVDVVILVIFAENKFFAIYSSFSKMRMTMACKNEEML